MVDFVLVCEAADVACGGVLEVSAVDATGDPIIQEQPHHNPQPLPPPIRQALSLIPPVLLHSRAPQNPINLRVPLRPRMASQPPGSLVFAVAAGADRQLRQPDERLKGGLRIEGGDGFEPAGFVLFYADGEDLLAESDVWGVGST